MTLRARIANRSALFGIMTSHFLVLPGGSYQSHSESEAEPVAEWIRSIGIPSSVFQYPLGPHPLANSSIHSAVRRLRQSGATRVGLIGFSAGGHAAALAATTAPRGSRVDAVVLAYPVVSMVNRPHLASMSRLGALDENQELRRALSVELLVDASAPPMFIWHTADDAEVPVSHSIGLCAALADHHVSFDLHIFDGGSHGLALATGSPAAPWTSLLVGWLQAQGWI